jgi:hypothetical protein
MTETTIAARLTLNSMIRSSERSGTNAFVKEWSIQSQSEGCLVVYLGITVLQRECQLLVHSRK